MTNMNDYISLLNAQIQKPTFAMLLPKLDRKETARATAEFLLNKGEGETPKTYRKEGEKWTPENPPAEALKTIGNIPIDAVLQTGNLWN